MPYLCNDKETNCYMEQLFNELVIEHFGTAFVFVCAVIVGIIALTAWCCKIWYKIKNIDNLPCNEHKNDIAGLKEKTFPKEELPCAVHQQKISEHGESLARLDTSVRFIVRNIGASAQEAQKGQPRRKFTQTHSPLRITDEGREKMNALGMDAMFRNNWPRIKELIDDGVKEKNAYDIDYFCIEQAVVYPEKFLSDGDILKLKNDAYREGLSLTSYMKIIAVLSRDAYFKECGIIDVDDTDNGCVIREVPCEYQKPTTTKDVAI